MSRCAGAPYHTYDVPGEGAPHARQCSSCGERQVYRPPTGKGVEFTDVLIEADDLRALIEGYETLRMSGLSDHYETILEVDALILRLEDLLPEA